MKIKITSIELLKIHRERKVNEDAVFKSPGEKDKGLIQQRQWEEKGHVGLRNVKAMELIIDMGREVRRV